MHQEYRVRDSESIIILGKRGSFFGKCGILAGPNDGWRWAGQCSGFIVVHYADADIATLHTRMIARIPHRLFRGGMRMSLRGAIRVLNLVRERQGNVPSGLDLAPRDQFPQELFPLQGQQRIPGSSQVEQRITQERSLVVGQTGPHDGHGG